MNIFITWKRDAISQPKNGLNQIEVVHKQAKIKAVCARANLVSVVKMSSLSVKHDLPPSIKEVNSSTRDVALFCMTTAMPADTKINPFVTTGKYNLRNNNVGHNH